jgi:hypothetical protein
VNFVMAKLQKTEASLVSGVSATKQRIRKLTKARDRVMAKSGANIVHALIDRKVQTAQREIAMMERGVEVMRAARALADNYEHVPEPAPPVREFTATAMMELQRQAERQIRGAFFAAPFSGF